MMFLNAKIAYFFAASSKYTLMSFLVIFLTRSGLDAQQAGVVTATRYAVEVLGAIIMNMLADKYKERAKLIVLLWTMLSAIIVFSMPWFIYLTTSVAYLQIIFTLLNAIAAFFDGGIIAAIDARVMKLTKEVSEDKYVKQRIWVSVGLGFTPFIAGIIVEKSNGAYFENEALFFLILFCNICLLLACYSLFTKTENKVERNISKTLKDENSNKDSLKETPAIKDKSSDILFSAIGKTLKNFDMIVLLFSYLAIGIGFVFQYSFVFLLLQVELKASKTMMGVGALLQALAEVFAAPFGIFIAKLFKNDFLPICISFFGFSISFFFYYFVDEIHLMLLVNILVGFSYSTFIYPAANIIYKHTDETNRGVFYAIALALLNGVGGCLAGLLGGYLFKVFGGRNTFFGGASFFSGVALVFIVLSLWIMMLNNNKGEITDKNKEPLI